MGHTDVRTTERYADYLTETLSKSCLGKKPNEAVHAKNTPSSQKSENVSICNLNINSEKIGWGTRIRT